MKNIAFAITCLYALACGTGYTNDFIKENVRGSTDPRPYTTSDPVFDIYYKSFEKRFNVKIVDIPIRFYQVKSEEKPHSIAFCRITYSMHKKYKLIAIDSDSWNGLSKYQRYQLIDHELGHCFYELDHDDRYMPNGFPASIMNSTIFDLHEASYYAKNNKYYVEEAKFKADNGRMSDR